MSSDGLVAYVLCCLSAGPRDSILSQDPFQRLNRNGTWDSWNWTSPSVLRTAGVMRAKKRKPETKLPKISFYNIGLCISQNFAI